VLPLPALVHEGPQRNGSIRDKKRWLCEYITAPDKHQRYLNEDELERAQEMKKMNDIAATGCLNATYFEVF